MTPRVVSCLGQAPIHVLCVGLLSPAQKYRTTSTVDSCWLWIVKNFNIISLNFGERCGTKLATLRCYVGSLVSGPVAIATVG
jgi:hypothetical protein